VLTASVLVGVLALVVIAVPWQWILARWAEQRLAAATGCAVRVAGPVELRPGLTTEVRLAAVGFAPREGSVPVCRGELAELDLGFRLWGLRAERLEARDGRLPLGGRAAPAALGLERLTIRPGPPAGTFEVAFSGHLAYAHGRIPLTAVAPVALSGGDVAGERGLRVDPLVLGIGDSHVTGRVSADLPPDERPRFDVRLEADSLRLADLGIVPSEREPASAASGSDEWSDRPFELAWLQGFDAKLSARADRLHGASGPLIEEVSIEGELERGALSLRHVAVAVDGGRVTGEFHADIGATPPTFSLEAEARGLELGRLLEEIDGSKAYSGSLHGQLQLAGRGASPRELVRSLSGELTAASPGGSVSTEHASLLTRDFFSVLRPSQRKASEVLNCLVLAVEFVSGVGHVQSSLLDVQDLVVIGDGQIDLAAWSFDLRFVPKPRDPSPLSTAATVRLTGSLSNPTVRTEQASLVTSTGKALLETLPWLSRSRHSLRKLVGAAEHFGGCREVLR